MQAKEEGMRNNIWENLREERQSNCKSWWSQANREKIFQSEEPTVEDTEINSTVCAVSHSSELVTK